MSDSPNMQPEILDLRKLILENSIELNKENTFDKLIEKGKERATLFSWDLTAERVWQSIEKVLYS